MKKRKDDDYELPEMTARDFKKMKPAREAHPELVAAYERTRGRPLKETKKVPVTLRLDPYVVEVLRATGPGWQTRTNAMLARWAKKEDGKRVASRK